MKRIQPLTLSLIGIFILVLGGISTSCREKQRVGPAAEVVPYQADAWREYRSDKGRFAVELPGIPTEQMERVDTEVGELSMFVSTLAIRRQATYVVCKISYSKFPQAITGSNRIRKVLDSARDELIAEQPTLKLIKEEEIELQSYPGRHLMLEDGNQLKFERMFLVKEYLYQLNLVAPKPSNDAVRKFQEETRERIFASFKIIEE